MKSASVLIAVASTSSVVSAFPFITTKRSSCTALNMGIFDGVKEAFSAPALERSQLDSERETPIDRWFGWNVKSEEDQSLEQAVGVDDGNFVDSMDKSNYLSVTLTVPMGIVFEENDDKYGGVFVSGINEDGSAAADGSVTIGDQLVAVGTTKVCGMEFDNAIDEILDFPGGNPKLVFFRGDATQFYGPTGPSQEWLTEFLAA